MLQKPCCLITFGRLAMLHASDTGQYWVVPQNHAMCGTAWLCARCIPEQTLNLSLCRGGSTEETNWPPKSGSISPDDSPVADKPAPQQYGELLPSGCCKGPVKVERLAAWWRCGQLIHQNLSAPAG